MEEFKQAHLNFKNKLSIDPTGNGSVGDILEDDEIDVLIEMANKAPTEHLYLYKSGDRAEPETVFISKGRLMAPPAPGSGEETAEPIDEYFLNSVHNSTKHKFVNISKLSKLLLHLFEFSTDGLTLNQLKDVVSMAFAVYDEFCLNKHFVSTPALPDVPEYMVLYYIINHIKSYELMELEQILIEEIEAGRGGEVLKLTKEEKDKLKQSDRVKKIKRKMGGLERAKGRLLIKQVLDKGGLSDDLIESIGKKYEPQKTIDTNLGGLKRKKRVSERKKRVSEKKKRVSKRKKRVSERKKRVSESKKKKRKGVSSR